MSLQYPRPNGPTLLRASIDRSRLTIRAYAALLFRSERTVSRWLDGETQIPRAILKYLMQEADSPDPRR